MASSRKLRKLLAQKLKRLNGIVTITFTGGTITMETKFKDFLNEQMQDPEFRKEYEALEIEDAIIQAFINARKFSGLTQKQLSEKTGITQPDINKLENGNANPSIRTLKRLANAMGMKLKVEFLPA